MWILGFLGCQQAGSCSREGLVWEACAKQQGQCLWRQCAQHHLEDPSVYRKRDGLERGFMLTADIGAGANSRGSRLGLSKQGSGAFAVTPLQRLLSPSFITPDNTFRPPTDHAQVYFSSSLGPWAAEHTLVLYSVHNLDHTCTGAVDRACQKPQKQSTLRDCGVWPTAAIADDHLTSCWLFRRAHARG